MGEVRHHQLRRRHASPRGSRSADEAPSGGSVASAFQECRRRRGPKTKRTSRSGYATWSTIRVRYDQPPAPAERTTTAHSKAVPKIPRTAPDENRLQQVLTIASSHVVNSQRRAEAHNTWAMLANSFILLMNVRLLEPAPPSNNTQFLFPPETIDEPAAIEAVRELAHTLCNQFFLETTVIAGQGEIGTLPHERRLIEYVTPGKVSEMTEFIGASVEYSGGTDDALISDSKADQLLAFTLQWVRDIDANDLVVYLRSDQVDYRRFVDVTANSSIEAAFQTWRQRLRQIASRIERAALVADTVDRGNQTIVELDRIRDVAANTAGQIGDDSLGTHFEKLAREERKRSTIWSTVAFAALATAAALAFLTLGKWVPPGSGWAAQLVHLTVTLPAAAGAAYASKISSRHRAQAWWAGSIAAQLHTFGAFSTPLDQERRGKLREQYGARLFTQASYDPSQQPADSASIAETLNGVVSAVRDRGKGTGGDS